MKPAWVFFIIRHIDSIMHLVDISELSLQENIQLFVGYNVILRQITLLNINLPPWIRHLGSAILDRPSWIRYVGSAILDPPSWIRHLSGFHYFLMTSEKSYIDTKLFQNNNGMLEYTLTLSLPTSMTCYFETETERSNTAAWCFVHTGS